MQADKLDIKPFLSAVLYITNRKWHLLPWLQRLEAQSVDQTPRGLLRRYHLYSEQKNTICV